MRRGRKPDDELERALSPSYRKIFDVVVRIPRGRVMTYGQVARAAGLGGAARLVGYAMRALGERVPWQRVLGSKRKGVAQVTIRDPLIGSEQRRLLEREGVRFSLHGGVDLGRYGHVPRRKSS
jgi:alkylated DNA nucleotide flippase Atl1